ncbi:hypothetical protein ACJX0J_010291, partial [Zea mays]
MYARLIDGFWQPFFIHMNSLFVTGVDNNYQHIRKLDIYEGIQLLRMSQIDLAGSGNITFFSICLVDAKQLLKPQEKGHAYVTLHFFFEDLHSQEDPLYLTMTEVNLQDIISTPLHTYMVASRILQGL